MSTKNVTKGLIGLEDISQGTGTFDRATSLGGTQTLTQLPIYVGTGDPEGAISANPGSIYMRQDGLPGASFYVKESGGSGNTGWVAK